MENPNRIVTRFNRIRHYTHNGRKLTAYFDDELGLTKIIVYGSKANVKVWLVNLIAIHEKALSDLIFGVPEKAEIMRKRIEYLDYVNGK